MAVVKYRDSTGVVRTLPSMKVNLLDGLEGKSLITTENATLRSNYDSNINGKTRALVDKDLSVWVDANELNGKIFNYMKNQRGEIVSYSKNYSTVMKTDEAIIPVYSDMEVEPKSLIFFNGNGYEVFRDSVTIRFFISCNILENKSGWGLLLTPNDLNDGEIIVGGNVTNKSIGTLLTTKKAAIHYDARFPAKFFDNHYKVKARAYSIIEKDGIEEIVYSDVISVQL